MTISMSTILNGIKETRDSILEATEISGCVAHESEFGEYGHIFETDGQEGLSQDELNISDDEIYARLLAEEDELFGEETVVADGLDQLFTHDEKNNCYTLDKGTIEEITGQDMGKAWATRGVKGMYSAIFDTELPEEFEHVNSSKSLVDVDGENCKYQSADDGYQAVVGDVVYMSNKDGSNSHSGIVVGVYGDKVAVMEFNSDNANGGGAIVLYDINGEGKSIRGGVNLGQEAMPNLLGDDAFGLETAEQVKTTLGNADSDVDTKASELLNTFVPDGNIDNAKALTKDQWAEITGNEYPKGWALAGAKDALKMIHGEDSYATSVLDGLNKSSDIPKSDEYVDLTKDENKGIAPKVGDLVYTDNAKGGNAHNGIVLSINEEKGTYQVLEFNSDDANGGATVVEYSINSNSEKSIKGFISMSKDTSEASEITEVSEASEASEASSVSQLDEPVQVQDFNLGTLEGIGFDGGTSKDDWQKITGKTYQSGWAFTGAKDALELVYGQNNPLVQAIDGMTKSSDIPKLPYYVKLDSTVPEDIVGSLVFTSNPDGSNPHCGIVVGTYEEANETKLLVTEFNSDKANGGVKTTEYSVNGEGKSVRGYVSANNVEKLNNLITSSNLTYENGYTNVHVLQHDGKTAVQYETAKGIFIAYVADDFSEIDTRGAIQIN